MPAPDEEPDCGTVEAWDPWFKQSAGDWDEVLAAEHKMTLALFDKMLATDETQKIKRGMLLTKLTHALDKHAHQEEMVVYPALREANEAGDADGLESEHG